MCSCLELNSWCGSGSQLEKAQKPALFSFNFDYVTGNRSENGVLVALNCQDLVTMQISRLGGKLLSREPVDRLRVVPHFSSGIVERAKRERT